MRRAYDRRLLYLQVDDDSAQPRVPASGHVVGLHVCVDEQGNFLRDVCVTTVMNVRDRLLVAHFTTCLILLQSYPPTNVNAITGLSRALLWIYDSQFNLVCLKSGISCIIMAL